MRASSGKGYAGYFQSGSICFSWTRHSSQWPDCLETAVCMSEYQRRGIYCLYEYTGRRSDAWIRDPQVCFAIECFMDDIAKEIGWILWSSERKILSEDIMRMLLKPIAANTNGFLNVWKKVQNISTGKKNEKNMQTRQVISAEGRNVTFLL